MTHKGSGLIWTGSFLSNRNIILLLKKHLQNKPEYIHFENGENVMLNKKSVDDINVKGKKSSCKMRF